jgi:hypothetical protein
MYHRGPEALKHRHFISTLKTLKTTSFNPVPAYGGRINGFRSCLISGLAKILYPEFANEPDPSLAQHIDTVIHAGILLGLGSARRMVGKGFRVNRRDNVPDYPLIEVMHDLKPEQNITAVHIPAADIGAGSSCPFLRLS